ncbi:hypothetical protein BJ741DRAFT_588423 [Chytriomyces cf. hyalinus JEL632]|nr:hypothetical protein BJ741DRAFT_588423 [Chytriomyces cf. hyalinus JEL632]
MTSVSKPKQKCHHAHQGDCVMTTCSCGDHRICKAVDDPATMKMGTCTEYVENYLEWSLTGRVKGRPLQQQLTVGGEFSGTTENREKFCAHPIPAPYMPRRATWTGNPLPFDGTTTQRTDYPAWDIKPDTPPQRAPWRSTGPKFECETTSQSDFKYTGTPQRYRRAPQTYVPNGAKFDGISSSQEAFKNWKIVSRPAGKHADPYVALHDDRDFKSTTAATYTAHAAERVIHQGATFRPNPPNTHLDSQTTSGEAFRPWDIKPRERTPKPQWIPNRSKFPTDTTYSDNFVAKSLPAGSVRPSKFGNAGSVRPPVIASCKFEGISTHHADYLPADHPRKLPDYAPKRGYIYQKDDRDFMTTSRKEHNVKVNT